jgi:hypothetical protein
VKGIKRATPIVAVRPGKAPTMIPDVTPMKTKRKLTGSSITFPKAAKRRSNCILNPLHVYKKYG